VTERRALRARTRWVAPPVARISEISEAGATAGVETADAEGAADPGRSTPAAMQAGVAGPGTRRRIGYEHLAPLFAQHAALPAGHPDREQLRAELIAGYRPVARHIARKYRYRGENPNDLEQVASIGLVLAVDRFEPGRGCDFLSFAVPTITGEVLRHFRDRTSAIRVPRRLRELQVRIYQAAAELGQHHGRAARPSEIAHRLAVNLEVVLEGLQPRGPVTPAPWTSRRRTTTARESGTGSAPCSRRPSRSAT